MKRLHRLAVCAAVLVLALGQTTGRAQKQPKDTFVYPPLAKIQVPEAHEVKLKNGMVLFLIEDHDYPTIDLRAMVRTGSVHEPADKIGLADVTGTVMRTGGTAKYPGDDLDKLLETLGAAVETGIGQTSGYVTVSTLKEDVDKGLEVLAGILMEPVFPEDKIELAKIEQKSAISRRNDDIGSITYREFPKLIFGKDSPYARQTEYATIDAITRDDLVAFHKAYFHPNHVTIAAWGDFNAKDMEKRIARAFTAWKPVAVAVSPVPKIDYRYDYSVNHIQKTDVNQSNIMLGHIGTRMDNPDYPALQIMNQILSWERMFKKVRTQEGLAYSVWGYYGAGYDHEGAFSSGCQTKSESTVKAVRIMLDQIKRLQTEEVTDEELSRSKDGYLNSFVFNFDSKAKVVERLMTYAYFGYPKNFMDLEKQGVEKVTKADILRVAKKYLKPDQVRILVVGKQEDFDEPLSNLGPVNTIDITIPQPKETVAEATPESEARGLALLDEAFIALGGRDALLGVKAMKVEAQITQVTPMGDMSFGGTIQIAYPDRFHMRMNTPYGEIAMVVNGDAAWMVVPQQGVVPMPDAQAQSMRKGQFRDPVILAAKRDALKVQHAGQRDLNGKQVEDVLVSLGENSFHLLLDPETKLPAGNAYSDVGPQGPVENVEVQSDYQAVAGVRIPMKQVTTSNGQKASEMAISKAEINPSLDPKLFEKSQP
jgi:predicted Zn-dependent peptidase/outer membrane lipoprotein-sorting protein